MNGIYAITFRGVADWGMGILLLLDGTITGADVGGALYDGNYVENGDIISVDVIMTVPPGVSLVQGIPAKAVAYTVPFQAAIPEASWTDGSPVLINLPPGPVNVIFRCLRTL